MSAEAMSHTTAAHGHDDHGHHAPLKPFLLRMFTTTNHKDIGTMYLVFALIMLLCGGCAAMVIRAELMYPGMQLVQPDFFNQMTTVHGLLMVFGAIMPAFTGFANWMVPMMIGAPDMALPRLNNFSFWLLPFAFAILLGSVAMSVMGMGAAPNFGWTFYAPLSTTYGPASTDFFIFSVHLMGISSILGAINVVVTIFNLRAPGMTLMKIGRIFTFKQDSDGFSYKRAKVSSFAFCGGLRHLFIAERFNVIVNLVWHTVGDRTFAARVSENVSFGESYIFDE